MTSRETGGALSGSGNKYVSGERALGEA